MGKDACGNWQGICRPFCNDDSKERGFRLLEFPTFIYLVLANAFGHYNASRRWTWYSPNGKQHNQIDYNIVRMRFQSGVNSARTRSSPGTDTGSHHDLLTMPFHLRLGGKINKPNHQNYRTISLITHPSKVMLKTILNRLKPQAEKIIVEEKAGFRAGRSTTEQIFKLRILCEKYLQHIQDPY